MNLKQHDAQLLQIADAALSSAAERSGSWLACKPGCAQCCVGVFMISPLDADRLREGLAALSHSDAERAQRIRTRVAAANEALRNNFPGDFDSGHVNQDAPGFEDFANDLPCPVLDPATQTCDLYASRPLTCRTFGPPVENEDGIGICELCFVGADDATIQSAIMDTSFLARDETLSAEVGGEPTLIPLALRGV